MRSSALVARREVRERLRSKAFRYSTLLLAAMAVAGVALPRTLSSDDDEPRRVRIGVTRAVTDDVRAALREIVTRPAEVRTFESPVAARRAVTDGAVDFVVTPDELLVGEAVEPDGAGPVEQAFVGTREFLRLRAGLVEAGLAGEAAQDVLRASPPPVVRVAGDDRSTTDDGQAPLVATATVLMYLLLIFYGQAVAGGVNEEKSSRVVELLLATMRPRQLLTGKVTGIGLVGLFQVAIIAFSAGMASLAFDVALPSGSPMTVAAYLVWFALGYALYCSLFAAAGALTSRPEEAQNSATPVYLLLAVGYATAFTPLSDPDATLPTVMSFVPLSAPFVMPARAALGSVPIPVILAAMGLTVAATVAVNRIGGRIYAGALLQFGPRVKLRQALAGERSGRASPSVSRR